jgi:hypothetical protein
MKFKVLLYVDNQITESSGKIFDTIEGAVTAVNNWNEQTEALYESVWAIVNSETGDVIRRGRIRQSFDVREKLMGKNV